MSERLGLWQFARRRLLLTIPVVLVATIVVFAAGRIGTPDPSTTALSAYVTPEQREKFIAERNLDDPLVAQYGQWFWGVLQGDFGRSLITGEPVQQIIADSLGVSLLLTSGALLLVVVGGIGLGTLAAVSPRTSVRGAVTGLSVIGVAMPNFLLALLLVLFVSVEAGLLPAGGYVPPGESLFGFLKSMILPWIALAAFPAGIIARVTWARVSDEWDKPHVRTARSLGLSRWRVITRYALPNALTEPITLLGVHVGYMLGGVVLVEFIFSLPGLGTRTLTAANQGDFPTIQATALTAMLVFVFVNFVVDFVVTARDPRAVRA